MLHIAFCLIVLIWYQYTNSLWHWCVFLYRLWSFYIVRWINIVVLRCWEQSHKTDTKNVQNRNGVDQNPQVSAMCIADQNYQRFGSSALVLVCIFAWIILCLFSSEIFLNFYSVPDLCVVSTVWKYTVQLNGWSLYSDIFCQISFQNWRFS